MTQTKTPALKPCPFCGCAMIRYDRPNPNDGMGPVSFLHPQSDCMLKNEVVWDHEYTAWNTRTITPADAAQVPEVKALIGEAEGAANWLDSVVMLIAETDCNPDDPDSFDEILLCDQLQEKALRATLRALTEGAKP